MKLDSYSVPVRIAMLAMGLSVVAFTNVRADLPEHNEVVNIVLKEWYISANVYHVKAGPVTFRASNLGKEKHELLIVKTDLSADKLPVYEGKVDEDMVGEMVGEIEEFSPNKTEEAVFNLAPGRYVLICNLAEREHDTITSHYMKGMRILLTVE